MVLVWSIHFRGGLAWEAENKNLIFNVSPSFLFSWNLVGFFFFLGIVAILHLVVFLLAIFICFVLWGVIKICFFFANLSTLFKIQEEVFYFFLLFVCFVDLWKVWMAMMCSFLCILIICCLYQTFGYLPTYNFTVLFSYFIIVKEEVDSKIWNTMSDLILCCSGSSK